MRLPCLNVEFSIISVSRKLFLLVIWLVEQENRLSKCGMLTGGGLSSTPQNGELNKYNNAYPCRSLLSQYTCIMKELISFLALLFYLIILFIYLLFIYLFIFACRTVHQRPIRKFYVAGAVPLIR